MSINRGMDKNVVHTYSGLLLSHKRRTIKKKTETVLFSEMWMDLEAVRVK